MTFQGQTPGEEEEEVEQSETLPGWSEKEGACVTFFRAVVCSSENTSKHTTMHLQSDSMHRGEEDTQFLGFFASDYSK